MKKNTKSSWDLFSEMFKVGDEVIIITAEDKYEWGKIEVIHNGIKLKRPKQKSKPYKWEEVTFMCHDGFPVRKLPPSFSDRSVVKMLEGTKPRTLQNIIRKALVTETCDCGEVFKDNRIKYSSWIKCPICERKKAEKRRSSYTGGHPWQIEGVLSSIYNIGNCTKYPYWFNHEFEEVIVMTDKNGLGGQLWDLPSIFEFEVT